VAEHDHRAVLGGLREAIRSARVETPLEHHPPDRHRVEDLPLGEPVVVRADVHQERALPLLPVARQRVDPLDRCVVQTTFARLPTYTAKVVTERDPGET
jgi:hypothetical protein